MASFYWSLTGGTAGSPTTGANWTKSDGTTGTAPGAGDDVFVNLVPGSILAPISYGDSSTANFNSVNYAGNINIGTTDTTSATFFGYWKLSATTVNIATPDGSASGSGGRIKIWNILASASTTNVQQTSSPTDTGSQTVRLLLASASAVVSIAAGIVGIATNMTGETSTVGIVNTGGTLVLGAGVTWTTGNVTNGGTLKVASAGTTINNASGGNVVTSGTGAITTINNYANASLGHRPSSGAMSTTINCYNGTTDFSVNPAAGTVTTINKYAGCTIKRNAANPAHITYTNSNTILAGSETIAA